MCVISLCYIFYIFQHCNLLENGFFCKRFRRSEGPLQKNFLRIKVEKDLKFLLAQYTLKYSKEQRKTVALSPRFQPMSPADHPSLVLIMKTVSLLSPYRRTHRLLDHIFLAVSPMQRSRD